MNQNYNYFFYCGPKLQLYNIFLLGTHVDLNYNNIFIGNANYIYFKPELQLFFIVKLNYNYFYWEPELQLLFYCEPELKLQLLIVNLLHFFGKVRKLGMT